MSTRISPKDKILQTAGPMFYRDGYRATGIDKVIAQSGVAKATFYKYFPSKDDLIVAWIEQAEKFGAEDFDSENASEPLFAYVDKVVQVATSPNCYGCTFQGSASEFFDPSHPGHEASIKIKNATLAKLQHYAQKQGITDAEQVSKIVFLIVEGIWASVRMFGRAAPIENVSAIVRKLVGNMATK
jgi:AcrR family transcriptional regulator